MKPTPKPYPFIDEAELQALPPSTLYHLEPIGVGTGMVESLTSYVGRLADAHTTSVSTLLKYELSKHFSHSYLGPDQLTSRSFDMVGAMNGRCKSAADWVAVLEGLTLRKELRYLTFLPYSEMLGDKSLLKVHRHWCPECLHQWREEGRICYEPLIWMTSAVKICPVHLCRLRERCPHCGQTGYHLESQYVPGYCPRCLKWLGDGTEFALREEEGVNWYRECALKVADLLATASKLDHVPNSNNVIALFEHLVTKRAKGCKALAQLLKLNHGYVVDWLQGEYPPNFENFIKILVMFRIDPAEVVSQRPRFLPDRVAADVMPCDREMGAVKPQKKIDWVALEILMTEMEEGRLPVLPIAELAERVGCSSTSIYKKLPALSKSVASRFYAAKREVRKEYLADIRLQVSTLISENGQMTKKEVYKAIGGKGRAKFAVVRDVFEEININQ